MNYQSEVISCSLYDHVKVSDIAEGIDKGLTRHSFMTHSVSMHGESVTNLALSNCLPAGQEFLVEELRCRYVHEPDYCNPIMSLRDERDTMRAISIGAHFNLYILNIRYASDTLRALMRGVKLEPKLNIQQQCDFQFEMYWSNGWPFGIQPGSIRVDLTGHLLRASW